MTNYSCWLGGDASAAAYMTVVGLAANFAELLTVLAQTAVDVIILDLVGMGNVPLRMLERLRREYPTIGIVIFASSVDMAPELMYAGALGYIVKDEDAALLLAAIRAAASGQRYVSPLVQGYLDRVKQVRRQHRFAPQELSVLKLLGNGCSTLEIAAELQIDPRTVQNYISSIRSKVGRIERTKLADFYRQHLSDTAV